MKNDEIRVTDRCGRVIYGMRVQLNCTQAEFGKKIGLTQSAISEYELGKAKPSATVVHRIAKRFGLDPKAVSGEIPMNWASL